MQRYYYLVDKNNEKINFDSYNYLQNTYEIEIYTIINNKSIRNYKGKKIDFKTNEKIVLKGKGNIEIDSKNDYVFFTNNFKQIKKEDKKEEALLNYFFDTQEPFDNSFADKTEGNGLYYLPLRTCYIEKIEINKNGWKMEIGFNV